MSEFNIFAKRLDEAFRKSRSEYNAAFHALECARQASRDANAWTPGDQVKITDGPLSSFLGTVEEIDAEKNKVCVVVSMFGRETPVELELDQVEVVEP